MTCKLAYFTVEVENLVNSGATSYVMMFGLRFALVHLYVNPDLHIGHSDFDLLTLQLLDLFVIRRYMIKISSISEDALITVM